jgi:Omp85 superfamily domain
MKNRRSLPKKAGVALIITVLGMSFAPPAVRAQEPPPDSSTPPSGPPYPIIASIRIERTDVFDLSNAKERLAPYILANKLHLLTREQVVRRELLFKEGDPADPDVLYESERNLRHLDFLHPNTRIETVPRDDGRVDVVVRTRDTWTTRPQLSAKREGNVSTYRVGLQESNFLGRGKSMQVSYRKDLDRTSDGLLYSDPRLFGTRWLFSASHFGRSDGRLYTVDLERPFYSLLTPWAGGGDGSHFSQVTTLRQDGDAAPGFRQVHTDVTAHWGRALYASYENVHRIDFGIRIDEDRFEVEPGEAPLANAKPVGGAGYVALPDDRRFRILQVEYRNQKGRFLKVNYLDRFDRYQDLNLGGEWLFSTGVSPAVLGVPNTNLFVESAYDRWFHPGETDYLHFHASTSGRYLAGIGRNFLTGFDLTHYVVRPPNRTLVFHLAHDWGHNLDGDSQFLLGGDSGLRGYDSRRFDGNKRVLANIEDRHYLLNDWLQLLSIGFATFADAGFVWRAGESEDLGDVLSDVGVGLRFDVTRSSKGSVFRIDYAYPLSRLGQDENSRGILSVATGLAF